MSGKRSSREEDAGRGRHRGVHKDEEAQALEDKAKGHERSKADESDIDQFGSELKWHTRGHQKGFGRNQEQEGESRHTRHGTRAPGAEHG